MVRPVSKSADILKEIHKGILFANLRSKMQKMIIIKLLFFAILFLHSALFASAASPPVITPVDNYPIVNGTPARIATGIDGKFYVTNTSGGTVSVYANNGLLLYTINAIEAPLGIYADPMGRIYISDIRSKYVGVYSLTPGSNGESSATLLFKLGKGDGEFDRPNAIAVSEQNIIYVADSKANIIRAYDQSGQALFAFGTGLLNGPVGITIDNSASEIYVIDYNNSCVRVFDLQGNLRRSIASGGNVLLRPLGAAVDGTRLFVTDSYHSVISVFDKASGSFLNRIGNYGNGLNEYVTPIDLSLDKDNKLFITNSNNQRVEALGVDTFTGLSVTPSSMEFTAYRGGTVQSQTVNLNVVGAHTAWTALPSSGWLSMTGMTGATPSTVTVTADPSGLAAGMYTSGIKFRTPSGTDSYLPVSLQVLKPVLLVDAKSLSLIYQKGSTTFPSGSLDINSVGAVLSWKATSSRDWLVLDKSSGATPARIALSVTAKVKDFKPGSYEAQIVIDAGDVVNGPATISVRLEVRKAGNIVVTTNLDEASFSVSGPDTFVGSGKSWTAENARTGSYMITFQHVKGYAKPNTKSFMVTASNTVSVTGMYIKNNPVTHIIAGSGDQEGNAVKVMPVGGGTEITFSPFETAETVKVASGDLDGDGIDEIVVTNGRNMIKVFSAQGTELASKSFDAHMDSLEIAVGDLNGDGKASIVAAYGYASKKARLVSVLSSAGKTLDAEASIRQLFAGKAVSIAIGDLDGDGRKELVTASGSALRVYDFRSFGLRWERELTEESTPAVSSGDLDGDGRDEIVLGKGPHASAPSIITVFRGDGTDYSLSFTAFEGQSYGVNVAVGDVDDDGTNEIIAGSGPENPAAIKEFKSDGAPVGTSRTVFDGTSGVHVGFGRFGGK